MAKNSDHLAGNLGPKIPAACCPGFWPKRMYSTAARYGGSDRGRPHRSAPSLSRCLPTSPRLDLRRDQLAAADLARQAQQIQSVAKESQNETRRLASAIDTLNGDRDRLYSRVDGSGTGPRFGYRRDCEAKPPRRPPQAASTAPAAASDASHHRGGERRGGAERPAPAIAPVAHDATARKRPRKTAAADAAIAATGPRDGASPLHRGFQVPRTPTPARRWWRRNRSWRRPIRRPEN